MAAAFMSGEEMDRQADIIGSKMTITDTWADAHMQKVRAANPRRSASARSV